MLLILLGAGAGLIWGWPFALLGMMAGAFVQGFIGNAWPGELDGGSDLPAMNNSEDEPQLYGSTGGMLEGENFTGNYDAAISGLGMSDGITGAEFTDINPSNGLPMVGGIGGVDVEGNAYGTDFSHEQDAFDHHSSGFDDGFSGFDDFMGGGFDSDF